jgi:hypothetical protein
VLRLGPVKCLGGDLPGDFWVTCQVPLGRLVIALWSTHQGHYSGPVKLIKVDLSGDFRATCMVPYKGLVRLITVDLNVDFWATSQIR